MTTLTQFKSTAYGQTTDSTKCFTLQQQKRILKKFVELDFYKKKSNIDSLMIDTLNTKLSESYQIQHEQQIEISKQKRKVKFRNRLLQIGIPLSFGIGFFIKP